MDTTHKPHIDAPLPEMPKRFDHITLEPKIYKKWLESGGFTPAKNALGESRSILQPPPNANGLLHIGHAYEVAIQDAFIRYWRMQGHKTLWQPGVDHAGFETQIVYERKLEKESRSRFTIPHQELYQEIYDFSVANQVSIRSQLERLGASCDWTRFKFTLDPKLVSIVYQTFKTLYDDGLIYKAKRPVNWCIKHQTTLSDLETTDHEQIDPLYYIKYGPFTLATVRPETKFGDTAVAVHPDDPRYTKYIGQVIDYESILGPAKIQVIADTYVNPEFGTGVVKITPAHDANDFEVAHRHNLPLKEVIDQFGRMNEHAGPYKGLKIAEARKKVIEDLKAKGLLEKVDENYTHTIKTCYKCGTIIEPRVIDQWWLSLTEPGKSGKVLRDLALEAVTTGKTKFLTEKYANQFMRWMESLRDWPLSRQLAWGIQLPVWYAEDGSIVVTNGEEPENSTRLTRESDVFDTWFSSCQWPFTTLGTTPGDLEQFYPTTLMVTGYDILFFWVARMLMLSLYTQDNVPYQVVYIHGLVRDKDKQKMSKSKGNVIDPLGVAKEYGSDAVRLALLYGTAPGTDPVLSDEKIRGMRNFTTKIWNIARFIALKSDETTKAEWIAFTDADHAIIKKLELVKKEVATHFETYQLHLALESIYHFVWHEVADTYIEASKEYLDDPAKASVISSNLRWILREVLIIVHPFAPFLSEAIWQHSFDSESCLMNIHSQNEGK
jgi:valyl-tRNA synthetase